MTLEAIAESSAGGAPWWVPVLTFIGGAVVTLIVEFLRSRQAADERRADAVERQADRDAERKAQTEERATKRMEEHNEREQLSLNFRNDCRTG